MQNPTGTSIEQNTLQVLELAVDLAKTKGIPEELRGTRPDIRAQNIADQCTSHRFATDEEFKAVLFWDFVLEQQTIPHVVPDYALKGAGDMTGRGNYPMGGGGI